MPTWDPQQYLQLAASAPWRDHFPRPVREWRVRELGDYYDILAPHTRRLDLWVTEYIHQMPDSGAIIEWYRGTGLRPFLDALSTNAARDAFTAEYGQLLRQAYAPQSDGRLLFPFRRLFVIAYR